MGKREGNFLGNELKKLDANTIYVRSRFVFKTLKESMDLGQASLVKSYCGSGRRVQI